MIVIAEDSVRFAHSGPSHNLLRPAIAELVSCGPLTGGLKPFCSCTKVHRTFSKGTYDPARVRGVDTPPQSLPFSLLEIQYKNMGMTNKC